MKTSQPRPKSGLSCKNEEFKTELAVLAEATNCRQTDETETHEQPCRGFGDDGDVVKKDSLVGAVDLLCWINVARKELNLTDGIRRGEGL